MTKKSGVKRKGSTKVNKKALKELISKGKEQGYLTYEEINVAFPEEALTQDQLDETLILFDDLDIEIIDEKKHKVAERIKTIDDNEKN